MIFDKLLLLNWIPSWYFVQEKVTMIPAKSDECSISPNHLHSYLKILCKLNFTWFWYKLLSSFSTCQKTLSNFNKTIFWSVLSWLFCLVIDNNMIRRIQTVEKERRWSVLSSLDRFCSFHPFPHPCLPPVPLSPLQWWSVSEPLVVFFFKVFLKKRHYHT